jgi:hypothetical protein
MKWAGFDNRFWRCVGTGRKSYNELATGGSLELRLLPLLCLLSISQAILAQQAGTTKPESVPETCPVTRPYQTSFFVPPYPYEAKTAKGQFWFGTDRLWTSLPVDGIWKKGLPPDTTARHTAFDRKLFWWRQGYDARAEPRPKLIVTGQRLDSPTPPLEVSPATNAFAALRSAMLVGIGFPMVGCWQITGHYEDDELSFVIWVTK